jgi:hypothetical protein
MSRPTIALPCHCVCHDVVCCFAAVGLSFEEQLLEHIPTSDHDQPVDVLVTPSRVCICTDALQQRGWA